MFGQVSKFLPPTGVLLAALTGPTAGADTFTVTNLDDGGSGSLREAVDAANSHPGTDTVVFASSIANSTITLDSTLGPLVITDAARLTIDGAGQNITVSGGSQVRVMTVAAGAELDLKHLTVAEGLVDIGYDGGGILNQGTLTVTDCTFSGNISFSAGGGISNGGSLTITNSTFSNNFALPGGGISNSGNLTVTDSTFSGNISDSTGGGIYNESILTVTDSTFSSNGSSSVGGGIDNEGVLTVINSTFSDNGALGFGGGIYNNDSLTVIHNTFSGNSSAFAADGGGIYSVGTLSLVNTILANNRAGGEEDDCFTLGTVILSGVNLVKSGNCDLSAITSDPMLGPLTDNGGPTKTFALQPGSPAIDAVTDGTCPPPFTDQRGVIRPQGAYCDIGAFEVVQQITIQSIIGFFDDAVKADALTGTGPSGAAALRLNALRNQLLTAERLIGQNNIQQACTQLANSLTRINTDGNPKPFQFVTGTEAGNLVRGIQQLRQDLSCS